MNRQQRRTEVRRGAGPARRFDAHTTEEIAKATGPAIFEKGEDRYRETFGRPDGWAYLSTTRSYYQKDLQVRATYNTPADEGLVADEARAKELLGPCFCDGPFQTDAAIHVSVSRRGKDLRPENVALVIAAFVTRHKLAVTCMLDQLGSYEADAHRSTILHIFAAGPVPHSPAP